MNPHKHLDQMRKLLADHAADEIPQAYMRRRITDMFIELDSWLNSGGSYPAQWEDTDQERYGAWVIGSNTAGYSPDPENVMSFEDWESASSAYVEMCRDWADADDEPYLGTDDEEQAASRAFVDSILSDPSFPLVSNEDYSMMINPNGMIYPIPTVLWLVWSDDATVEGE